MDFAFLQENSFSPAIGGLFALISAFMWAWVSVIYRDVGRHVSPAGITIAKSSIACVFLLGCIMVKGLGPLPTTGLLFLVLSGVLGIAIGDTYFFKSLNILGLRSALFLTLLIPLFTLCLSCFILKERVLWVNGLGIILTLSGIGFILWERSRGEKSQSVDRGKGLGYALISAIACAVSIICAKAVIADISALTGTFIRQLSGLLILIIWATLNKNLKEIIQPCLSFVQLKQIVQAAFLGTFLATWMSLEALKYTDAYAATTLNATSPLFILFITYVLWKEKVSLKAVLSSFIAMAGAALIFIR